MKSIAMRWPIRWKLLALMWLLVLLPVLTVAWIDIKALAQLGTRLATETGQALSDQTRANLEQHADHYARLISIERRLIEGLVHIQARDAERVLRTEAVTDDIKIFWHEDFVESNPALALQRDPEKYLQKITAHTQHPLPVSYTQPAMYDIPGVARETVQGDAQRLSAMLGMLQAIQSGPTNLVHWQYISLEKGLHAIYPGHGGYPPNFDPRLRGGYQTQKTRRTLVWSGPHRDVTSRLAMLSATLPLFDRHQRFIGITGIDVPLTRLLETVGMASRGAEANEILLASISPASARDGDIEIIARKGDVDDSQDWLEKPKLDFFSPDEPRAKRALLADMRRGRDGYIRTKVEGRDTLCVYRKFDVGGNYLIYLVPGATASRPAMQAAEYALTTTRRQVDALIPIAILAVSLAAVVAFLSARAITEPIRCLSDAVQEVTEGNFNVRVDIRTGDELEQLGNGFNRMVPQIEAHAYMKKALIVAREVQQRLLPANSPVTSVLDIQGACHYADETGGDYYDYIDLRARDLPVLGIAIGDVSGHGVASALLMATARAMLHGSDLAPRKLGATLQRLNQTLAGDLEAGRFMTLFLLMFDFSAREITWASAGHDPVLCYRARDRSHFELVGNDIPLGVDSHWQFGGTDSRGYLAGDVFLLATDGAWEAQSPTGERFGKPRLAAALEKYSHLSAAAISAEISQVIAGFRGGRPPRDDLTLVVVKVRDIGAADA